MALIYGDNMWDKELFIEAKETAIDESQAIRYLKKSWFRLYGTEPKDNSLAILYAQTILETGRFKYCYCYNVGNQKSKSDDEHHWTMYKCSEILNGKEIFFEPPHDQTKFRAFKSMQDGFDHHLEFLSRKKRYKKAWEHLIEGDVVAYTKALKDAGYFTASLNLYMKGMTRLTSEFFKRHELQPSTEILIDEITIIGHTANYSKKEKPISVYSKKEKPISVCKMIINFFK